MSEEPAILELRNVTKRYDGPGGTEGPLVLSDVSLRVLAGESVAIIGPSGSGKSTLLNIMGSLDRPSSGIVTLSGRDLNDLDDSTLAKVRNTQIGFVFQLHHLLPQCTVLENVLVPALPRAAREDENVVERARALLGRVGLGDRMDYPPNRLSGGELQRTAVVRALINRPGILLADEPTGSLDRASAEDLSELLIELNREEGTSLVVVTHWGDLARKMQRALALRDGTLKPSEEVE